MGPLKYYHDKKIWAYRCKKRACHKQLQPHDYHPIFFMSAGNSSTPLQKQVAVLFCAVVGVSSNAAHLLLDMDHKPVERILPEGGLCAQDCFWNGFLGFFRDSAALSASKAWILGTVQHF